MSLSPESQTLSPPTSAEVPIHWPARSMRFISKVPSGVTAFVAAIPDRKGRIISGRIDERRKSMTATLEGVKHLIEVSD